MNEILGIGAVVVIIICVLLAIVSLIRLSDKNDDLRVTYGKLGLGLSVVGLIIASIFILLVVF